MEIAEPVWKSAVGEYVFDDQGKKYIDFTSGVMVTNLGHANPKVISALKKKIKDPLLYCYRYPFSEKKLLKQALIDFTGGMFSDISFGAIGAEAVENSMVIAARYFNNQNRKYFISFSNAYHGKTLGASLLSDIKRYKSKLLESPSASLIKRFPYPANSNDDIKVMNEIAKHGKKCIAIYIEAIQGSTLLKASPAFMQRLRKWTKDNNVLLVVDEIQTGFYRTGPKFSYLDSNIIPDMICVGKGLTSSLPLSGVLLSKRLQKYNNEHLDCSTHSSNPLSIAASLACLEEYSSNRFLKALKNSIKSYGKMMKNLKLKVVPQIEVLYHGGIFGGLKFNIEPKQNNKITFFVNRCRQNGLFLPLAVGPKSNIIKLTPPLTISSRQIKSAGDIMMNVLKSLNLLKGFI